MKSSSLRFVIKRRVSAPPKRTAVRTCHRGRCAFVDVPAHGRRTSVLTGASERPGSRSSASASSSSFPRARRAIGARVETFFSRRPRARSRREGWSTRAGPRWRRRPRRRLPHLAGASGAAKTGPEARVRDAMTRARRMRENRRRSRFSVREPSLSRLRRRSIARARSGRSTGRDGGASSYRASRRVARSTERLLTSPPTEPSRNPRARADRPPSIHARPRLVRRAS